MGANVVNW